MVAPAIPPVQINLRNYQPPLALGAVPPAPIDGLRTLNFERTIIQDIHLAHSGNRVNELNALTYCLSQALVASNEQFSDLVASALKSRILTLARLHPDDAQTVLAQREFRNSQEPAIKDLIKRVGYYNSNLFSKFLHHLHGGLQSNKTVSGKAFYAGIALVFGGAATQFALEDEKARKIGITGFAVGGLMVLTSVIHAGQKVYDGEP